jgi:hypothetical protein
VVVLARACRRALAQQPLALQRRVIRKILIGDCSMPPDKAGLDTVDQVVQLLTAHSNSQTSSLYSWRGSRPGLSLKPVQDYQASIPEGGPVVARTQKDYLIILVLPVPTK